MLAPESCLHHCLHASTPATMTSSQILVRIPAAESGEFSLRMEQDHTLLTPLGDGPSKLRFDCNPSFAEGERKQSAEEEECAYGVTDNQEGCTERGGGAMEVKQDDCGNGLETSCRVKPGEDDEAKQCADGGDHPVKPTLDVDACLGKLDKLNMDAREAQNPQVTQGELIPTHRDMQGAVVSVSSISNNDLCADRPTQTVSLPLNDEVSNLSHEKINKEQGLITSMPRKSAAWRAPEQPKPRVAAEEPEFVMEASTWPTLAEARHARPSDSHSLPAHKETTPEASATAQKENSMEAPKQLNTNHPHPGPKSRSSYRKGGGAGYGRSDFQATENIPVPPMGVHVPNANNYNPDQSMKGSGRGGMNNFFPGPYQVPANGPFYQHNRGEGLAPFPQNSVGMPPYGRGFPGWQHHGRGLPTYDQQQIGPRYMQPQITPYMNFNAAPYGYPPFPASDMPYRPPVYGPPMYNHANPPYVWPIRPPGVARQQGWGTPSIFEMLQTQIEYYFSKENLVKDTYLTSKMDEEGFVPVALIASFPRVQRLTMDTRVILDALKNSPVVEVNNGKLRSLEWRRQPVATSQINGAENGDFLPRSSKTLVDHTRERVSEISREQVSNLSGEEGGLVDDLQISKQQ